jgi:hypothetical protein
VEIQQPRFGTLERTLKKSGKDYSRPKRAFDEVRDAWSRFNCAGLIAATNYASGQPGSKSPATPSKSDFIVDFENAIRPILEKRNISFSKFTEAYRSVFDDDIEREMHAQAVLGSMRHSIEQRCGALFITRGLFPVKKYFTVIRQAIAGRWVGGGSILAPYKAKEPRDFMYEQMIEILNERPEVMETATAGAA